MIEAQNNPAATTDLSPLGVHLQNETNKGSKLERKENFLHENSMKSLRQSLENLLKEDSGSESDKASCKKESVKSLIKTRMKRSSLSAHNYHFSQMWNIKDGPKMD